MKLRKSNWKQKAVMTLLGMGLVSALTLSAKAQGTWTPATHPAPDFINTTLLLTDGTVMCHVDQTPVWYKLTPDATGSYINGTWSQLASLPMETMPVPGSNPVTYATVQYAPLYYASAVLADGRVIVIGGEYNGSDDHASTAMDVNAGAIYNPLTDKWAALNGPTNTTQLGDAGCCMMTDGKFLLSNQFGNGSWILDPKTLKWTDVPTQGKLDVNSEETWTLLPNNSILTIDCDNFDNRNQIINSAEIYTPGATPPTTGMWASAGETLLTLPDAFGMPIAPEIGGAVYSPKGWVFATGATGHNALYTVSTGVWSSPPDFPKYTVNNTLTQFVSADGPSCLLPNGNVLTVASPFFAAPNHFFEFDGTHLTPVTDPPNASNDATFYTRILPLPNGQVMMTDGSGDVEFYTPATPINSTQLAAWKPTITAVPRALKAGFSYTVSGTQLNGLSQATSYGDDCSQFTNYPLVRVTNQTSGVVRYLRTHNHSTMSITPGQPGSTQFDVPSGLPSGNYNLQVVANGIPSASVAVTVGMPNVLVTSVQAARVNVNTVTVTFNLLNSGGSAANNVKLTGGKLNTINSTTLPTVGTIAASNSQSVTLTFTSSTPITSGTATFTVNGSYTGGTFSSGLRVSVP